MFERRYPGSLNFATSVCVLYASLLGSICLQSGPPAAWGQESSAQDSARLLREAEEHLIQGEYAAVAEIAKRISELSPARATLLQRSAELLYLSGHAEASLPLFNRVIELTPEQAPDNWQRGIALCTCGQFEAGAEQFKTHHEVNPDDVENSAWYFLCVAKTRGLEDARATVIPSRGDGRQPMMSVLEMLQGKIAPPDVLSAAAANTRPGPARNLAVFYARLYVGLYYDSLGDSAQAIRFLKESLSYESNGYMAHTARVYLSHRFPDSDQTGK